MPTSSTPPIVYETDLEPIYYQDCYCHKELVFCKNWKFGGEIFKYNSSGTNSSIRRVQFDCCVYKDQEIDEEMSEKVKTFKGTLDPRQVVQNNCFQHLSPLYSKFCEHYGHMIGFFWNSLKDTVMAYDIADGLFQETKDCGCCLFHKDVYLTNHIFFEKSHRDEYGQTIICMDINWHTKEHGKMSIFFNSQGFFGEYRWNRVAQCFKLMKQLDVKTTEYEVADRTDGECFESGIESLNFQNLKVPLFDLKKLSAIAVFPASLPVCRKFSVPALFFAQKILIEIVRFKFEIFRFPDPIKIILMFILIQKTLTIRRLLTGVSFGKFFSDLLKIFGKCRFSGKVDKSADYCLANLPEF